MTSNTWPVATIPTPHQPADATETRKPGTEHQETETGGILLPLRWVKHGDLRIILREPDTVFISEEDLHTLTHTLPPATTEPTLWEHATQPLILTVYPLTTALTLLEQAQTALAAELAEFLRESLPLLVRDETIDNAIGLEGFLSSWTVQQAAVILSRDPSIDTGRTRLFDCLAALGWIERGDDATWQLTKFARRNRLLTVHTVSARTSRDGKVTRVPYDQIYVTPHGLEQLRLLLSPHPVIPLVDEGESS